MKVRVEYTYDPQSRNWCFQVPSLGIIGGADTREQAEEQATRKGVERAGMPRLHSVARPQPLDHVEGRRADRLVHEDEPVQGRPLA